MPRLSLLAFFRFRLAIRKKIPTDSGPARPSGIHVLKGNSIMALKKSVLPKKLPWFRMYCDFLDDPKILSLAFEDQRHFVALLALKGAGVIDQECSEKAKNKLIAHKLWIGYDAIDEVKRRLVEAMLIDTDWQPMAWNTRQFVSDHDQTGADRQRKFRESQRNALRNGPVTLPDTDTDKTSQYNSTNTHESDKNDSQLPEMVNIDGLWYQTENGELSDDQKRAAIERKSKCRPAHREGDESAASTPQNRFTEHSVTVGDAKNAGVAL